MAAPASAAAAPTLDRTGHLVVTGIVAAVVAWGGAFAVVLAGLTAVGAFAVTGVLLALAGLWRPLGRLIAAIPGPLANAMLAGVLLSVCLAPVRFAADSPLAAAPIVLTGWC